jgi:hypothetical protein
MGAEEGSMTGKKPLSVNALREARRLIREARELIVSERRWTKHALARDRKGEPVLPGSTRAKPVVWCLLGAVLEVEHRRSGKPNLQSSEGQIAAHQVSLRLWVALEALAIGCLYTICGTLNERIGPAQEESEPAAEAEEELLAGEKIRPAKLITAANDRDSTTFTLVQDAIDLADKVLEITIAGRKPKDGETDGEERKGR